MKDFPLVNYLPPKQPQLLLRICCSICGCRYLTILAQVLSSCGGVAATGGHRNLGCIGGSTGMAVSSQRVQRFGICLNQPTIKQIFMSINQKNIALENSYQRLMNKRTQQSLNFDKYFYHNQKHKNYQNNPCPTFRCKVINYVLIQKHSFICNNPDMLEALYPFSYGNDKHFI